MKHGKVVALARRHPLVGTWIGEGDDARAEYTVSPHGSTFEVSGVDGVDGERFVISNVSWDGRTLQFTSLMPSTGRLVIHNFRLIGEDKVEHAYTLTDKEVWSKKVTCESPKVS